MLVRFGKFAAVLVLAFAGFAIYGHYADQVATRRAASMCDSIAVGDDAAALYARASAGKASSVYRLDKDGVERMMIVYVGMPPFSRFICTVESEKGRVVAASTSHLD